MESMLQQAQMDGWSSSAPPSNSSTPFAYDDSLPLQNGQQQQPTSTNFHNIQSAEMRHHRGDYQNSEDSPSSSDSGGHNKSSVRPNRDPMSHRIIEKRRRDRMNNCLTNLSKLIPNSFLKKGRGRIEKTEIIEMAIRYLKHLEEERKHFNPTAVGYFVKSKTMEKSTATEMTNDFKILDAPTLKRSASSLAVLNTPIHHDDGSKSSSAAVAAAALNERYKQGFYDCIAETLRFLAVADGLPINDTTKAQLLLHLREYFGQIACDTLGPIFSELLQTLHVYSYAQNDHALMSSAANPSMLAVQPPAPPSISSYEQSPCPTMADEEPLNMSLKKPRLTSDAIPNPPEHAATSVGGSSQLRELLVGSCRSDDKGNMEAMDLSSCASSVAKRPHIFRYSSTGGQHRGHELPIDDSSILTSAEHHQQSHHNHQKAPLTEGASNASTSTQYPSSPGSQHSVSGSSMAAESPPRVSSPTPMFTDGRTVPAFALHQSGQFYVPLSVPMRHLEQSVVKQLTELAVASPIARGSYHNVTITVNFYAAPRGSEATTSCPSVKKPDASC